VINEARSVSDREHR